MAWNTSDRLSRLPPNWSTTIQPSILRRDKYQCKLKYVGCLGTATEVDHIERGDNHDPKNLQAACERCHATKSGREGNQAKARLKKLGKRPPERHPGLRT